MAKKVTPKQTAPQFSIQGWDLKHYRMTEQYVAAVQALFDRATLSVARSAASLDPDKPFSFDDFPAVKSEMEKIISNLASQLQATIESGAEREWLFACQKNDKFLASIMNTSKLSKERLAAMQDRNLDALSTFQQRKIDGMDLSQRVWRYVGQYKSQLESALDVGLGEGLSAQELARDVRQNLREPDRLFRRVRDKRGNLVLSKAARAYHPGQGVYRSSVKNAQRLTRSEINMAYRESDYLRWQQLDFVVGFEIHRSNHEPLCKCKMCERLKGRYPKDFKFKGWHPQCMCYATPILMDEETFDENELGDLKAALYGTEYKKRQSKNVVTDVPDGFKEWVAENADAVSGWKSTPYFIRDNFKDGDLSKGLKFALPEAPTQAPATPNFDAVLSLATVPEVVEFMKQFGFTNVDFGTMRIGDVKNIAHTYLALKERFGLAPFSINPNENGRNAMARGGAENISFNRRYFTPNAQAKAYQNDVGKYQDELRERIRKCDAEFARLQELEYQYQQSNDYVDKLALKDIQAEMDKNIAESLRLERMLERGTYRHNVELAPDSVLLNSAQHEIAHTIKAQIIGGMGIFGTNPPTARENTQQAKILNDELKALFRKHRKNADEWLSIYGQTDHDEFMAEAFVLYLNGQTKYMPDDVKEWFDKLERYAKGESITESPKVDPVQKELDALMPSVEAAKGICKEWGMNDLLKQLESGIASRDVGGLTTLISQITSLGTKYSTELGAYVTEAGNVIREIKAAGVNLFPDEVACIARYLTNLSNDKSLWVSGGSFYKSELESLKTKLKNYQASPEAKLSQREKELLDEVRTSIKKANEWGVKTTDTQAMLDTFLANPDDDNYWKLWDEQYKLDGRIRAAENKVDKLIADSRALIKDALALGLDAERVKLDQMIFSLDGSDKALMWSLNKREINAAFKELQDIVEAAKKKKREQEAQSQADVLNPKFTGVPHPALKTEYKTDADVNETFTTINSEFTTGKWFEHGDLKLALETKFGNNGSTNMSGRIWLTKERLAGVKSALAKIAQGKTNDITFAEADAMATFWHEICHNRNIPSPMKLDTTKIQTRFMELANEFVARHTLPEFYSKLGASEVPHAEFQETRKSTGYNSMVTNYDYVIKTLGLDHSKVLLSVRNYLFTGGYNDQETGLTQALLDAGITYADGKAVKKSDMKALLKLIRMQEDVREYDYSAHAYKPTRPKEEIILAWLKSKGFIK